MSKMYKLPICKEGDGNQFSSVVSFVASEAIHVWRIWTEDPQGNPLPSQV